MPLTDAPTMTISDPSVISKCENLQNSRVFKYLFSSLYFIQSPLASFQSHAPKRDEPITVRSLPNTLGHSMLPRPLKCIAVSQFSLIFMFFLVILSLKWSNGVHGVHATLTLGSREATVCIFFTLSQATSQLR